MPFKIIYIGKLIPRKHIIYTIIAVIKLSKFHEISLDICGNGILRIPVGFLAVLFKPISYYGFVDTGKRNILIKQSDALIMVSEREALVWF